MASVLILIIGALLSWLSWVGLHTFSITAIAILLTVLLAATTPGRPADWGGCG